jgi:hypothetical protein
MAIMGEVKVLEFRFRLARLSQGHCMVAAWWLWDLWGQFLGAEQ